MNRKFFFVAAASLLSGCYRQHDLATPVPQPATRIIAQVTDTGSVAMANAIGVAATEVEGIVSQATDAAWKLQLIRVDHRGGTSSLWKREEVNFPRIALTNVREKRLDKKRSWLLAGALTAGVVLVSRYWGGVITGGSGDGEPPPPP